MTEQAVTFSHYDTADYLESEEDIAAYLMAVMEENDPALLAAALGDIARARNMSQLAKEVGMSREGLYKALSGEGNPAFSTISKVANALGLRLTIEPLSRPNAQV
ncbi:probable addiction module antidote protein [Ectothiorhodospira mobilis]|jgi:probable addiction module antidote protein|uniref:Probable addiction module antidote protein n=1 Tax=Ectothiorhodospira mobilis TaxID=195064 RepID=A0A1I4T1Q0_ECTMO|nr:addiction module antidote protein [Ectothiorhodospira mobilis]MBK1692767.1 putative addiction module antidote protein [Ectothiorhodospira mobilis]SFM70513.1 probable addiction module antidote protein [Ectothiorhodospira mobilis]